MPTAGTMRCGLAGSMCCIDSPAKVCGRSYQALNKWRLAACLPRTDYTGETRYAELLAAAAKKKGHSFEAAWLLEASSPHKAAA